MLRRFLIVIGLTGLVALPAQPQAMNFTATMDTIRITARPEQTEQRVFRLTLAKDYKPTQFRSVVEDWWKSEDGRQSHYVASGTLARSCGPWVTLNPAEKKILPGETLEVRITVAIPERASPGGYWCALTVNQVPDPLEVVPEGVRINFLASVSVSILVLLEPVERMAKVVKVEILPGEAQVTLSNEGNAPLGVQGRFEFVPDDAARKPVTVLIPRHSLLTEPVRTARISAALPPASELPSGMYMVRAILDIGLEHMIGVQRRMEVRR